MRRLRAQERAGQIGLHHAFPFLDVERVRGFADIDAGVVDENVDPAELTLDALDHGGDGGLVGDVGDDGHRLAAALFELGDCRDRFRFIASDDGNRGAGLRQPACHAEPDATIAAGDDRDLAAEIKWFWCHSPIPVSLVMRGLDPRIHLRERMDCRVICAKTRFALLPGNDRENRRGRKYG